MQQQRRFFSTFTSVLIIILLLGAAFSVQAQATCDAALDYLTLGNEQYSAGNNEGATNSFTCAIQQHPNSAAAYNGRGNAYRNLANYTQAIADYSRAIELAPDFALAYNNRGWAYYQQGEYNRALSDYNQAIALDSSLAYAYNNRGLIYQLQSNYDLAIDDFNTAIQLGHNPLSWPQFNLQQAIFERDKRGTSTVGPNVTATPQATETLEEVRSEALRLYNARDYEAAVEAFTRLLVLEPDNPTTYFRRAFAYGELDEYEKAIEDNTQAIELGYSPLQYAYHNRAWDYSQLGLYENTIPDYDKALELDPEYARAYLNRGFAYGRMGETEKAIEDMKSALAADYDSPEIAYNNLGFYSETLGDLQGAIDYYDQALEIAPTYTRALRNRGGVYGDLGDFENAIADFNLAIELEPDSAGTYLSRGLYLLKVGDQLNAASDYNQWITRTETRRLAEGSIALEETRSLEIAEGWVYSFSFAGESGQKISVSASSETVDSLIVILDSTGQPLAAADDLSSNNADAALVNLALPTNGTYTLLVSHAGGGREGAIELNFGGALSAEVLAEQAQSYLTDGNYALAVERYNALLELEPNNRDALYNRADAYFNLENYPLAVDDFSAALELDPTDVQTWHYRGVTFERMENYEAALADFNKAIELDPNYTLSQFGRGNALRSLGRDEEAIAAYDNVLKVDPDYVGAYNNRGLSYEALGQLQDAIDDYTRAMELDPAYNTLLFDRGTLYLDLQQYENAIADFLAAAALEPQEPSIYLSLGTAHLALEDRDQAATDFLAYLELVETESRELPALTSGQTIFLEMAEGVVYRIPFSGDAGEAVTFSANSETADPLIVILDARGIPLIADDDGGNDLASLIDAYELPAEGRYTLLVGHAGGGSEGSIQLHFGPQAALSDLLDAAAAYQAEGNHTEAINTLTEALAQATTNPDLYFDRAFSYGEIGEYELAAADYSQAIELGYDPLAAAYHNRGWINARLNANEAALADYDQAIELDPEYALAFYNRGYLHMLMDNPQDAIADYDQALALEYQNPLEIYYARGGAYIDLEQWQNAIDDYDTVIADNADDAGAYLGRGIAFIGLEKRLEAAQDFVQWMDLVQLELSVEDRIVLDPLRDGDSLTLSMAPGHVFSIPFTGTRNQTITITAQSATADALLVILDSDGEPLIGDDDSGEGLNALIAGFQLPESGDYTLLVSHAGGGSIGRVNISLAFLPQV